MNERIDLNLHDIPVNQVFRKLSEEYFLDSISANSSVLDIGCGDGAISLPLAERGCRVEAFDAQSERIEKLNEYKGDLTINARAADFWDLPYELESFDYVISRQFLSHFADWMKVLERKLSFCKSGGKLVFQHNSQDNHQLAQKTAQDQALAETVLSKNKGARAGRATLAELQKFCADTGCTLERATPLTFFLPNSPFMNSAFDKDALAQYAKTLSEKMSDPKVYDFVYWFERSVISRLPQCLTSQLFVVISKA